MIRVVFPFKSRSGAMDIGVPNTTNVNLGIADNKSVKAKTSKNERITKYSAQVVLPVTRMLNVNLGNANWVAVLSTMANWGWEQVAKQMPTVTPAGVSPWRIDLGIQQSARHYEI